MRSFRFHAFWFALSLFFGFFALSTATFAGFCGDGIVDQSNGEQCDDENFFDFDGCSSYCQLEDIVPPTVESVSIADEASNIATTANRITVRFSEKMNIDTINSFNIQLLNAGDPLDIELDLQDDQKTVDIRVNQELISESRHVVRVRYVKDEIGNEIAEEFFSVFDTAVAIDTKAPNVVVTPPGGTYHFPQSVEIKAYIGDYTGSDEFLDPDSKIYYTLNGPTPTESSPRYTRALRVQRSSTLRYFGIDKEGNRTPVKTERYELTCPDREGAEKVSRFPNCRVTECKRGYILTNNLCLERADSFDPSDYSDNSVTAPYFSSPTPMTISRKPAISITNRHRGLIPRPIIFRDLKRGTEIFFERDTTITGEDGKPFVGYILQPENYYIKDYPIHFGYVFRSIFKLTDSEGEELSFHPPIHITVPFTEAFEEDEEVKVFTYDPVGETYSEYPEEFYRTDLEKGEAVINTDRSRTFFVAQTGKSYNRSVFQDAENHWARNHIEALYRRGIVKGRAKGRYDPDGQLTRAEFTKIALEAIGAETEDIDSIENSPFRDVALYAWYLPYVKKAKELGLVRGYEDGTFKPEQPINRAEAIKILIQAFDFDLTARGEEKEDTDSDVMFDDLLTQEWYYPYTDFAIQNRLLGGIRLRNNKILNSFGPGRNISRGEMAKLANKTIELKEELEEK